MVFKDQDDCSKRLVCELNAMRSNGKELSEHEEILADAFGKGGELDVGKDSLEFDIAAVLGREVMEISRNSYLSLYIFFLFKIGGKRCELSYRRCETPVSQMLSMIETEIEEIEIIQKELDNDAVSIEDINNRFVRHLPSIV